VQQTPSRTRAPAYPGCVAQGLGLVCGTVAFSCKTSVCQRTKSSGMRGRRRGAQSTLALRCPFLTPSRWQDVRCIYQVQGLALRLVPADPAPPLMPGGT